MSRNWERAVTVEQLIIDLLHGSSDLGLLGLVLVAAAFFLISLAFLPRAPACVVAGLVYGVSAFPVVLVASTLGALVGFMIARRLFRERFRQAIEHRQSWRRIVDAIDSQGWVLVALLRFASPVPGSATTYLAGLTSIDLWPYVGATFLGLAPQTFLFVFLGAVGPAALGGSLSAVKLVFMLVGVVTSVLIIWQIGARARATLSNRLELVDPLGSPQTDVSPTGVDSRASSSSAQVPEHP
jgi:uncharacterized membrane protein YdjX (TVP38/TMEM64 family)